MRRLWISLASLALLAACQPLIEKPAVAQTGELVSDGEALRLLLQPCILDGAGGKVGEGAQYFDFIRQEEITIFAVEIDHTQPARVARERQANKRLDTFLVCQPGKFVFCLGPVVTEDVGTNRAGNSKSLVGQAAGAEVHVLDKMV